MCKIEPYINPLKPGVTYYQATYANETYHHTDKAIVKKWLIEQILTTPYKEEKQRINQKAIDAFYKK
jgi:hypothetical protein